MTAGSVAAPQKADFRADIQGLRAIAVGAVLLFHAGLAVTSGGYVGVDVFFVISGFLITSHLLRELETHGRIRFATFYARRARRILPASFVVLILSVLAAWAWFPPVLMYEVRAAAIATALYVPNMFFAREQTDYLAEATPSLFLHYWSLGVEEQFYLLWPLLLLVLWNVVKSRRMLMAAVVLLVALSFVAGVILTWRNQPLAFFLLPTRAWELGIGGVAAVVLSRRSSPLSPVAAGWAGWIGLAAIAFAILRFDSHTPFPGYAAMLPTAGAVLVILAGATRSRWGPGRLLSVRGMVFIGTISYSLYLVHWPVLIVPQVADGTLQPLPLWLALVLMVACVPLAWVMYRVVENPVRSLPWLVSAKPRRTLLLAALVSLATVALASTAYVHASSRPLSVETEVASTTITNPPQATAFVPANLTPSLRDASADIPILYADDCHRSFESTDSQGCLYGDPDAPRIALFGDSHAAHWFPALHELATRHGFAVQTFTKSSCPSVTGAPTRNGVPYDQCTTWRDGVIDNLNRDVPAAVVISNSGTSSIGDPDGSGSISWEQALGTTIDRLTAPAIVIADTPDFDYNPSLCLSVNLDSATACARPRSAAVNAGVQQAEERATLSRGATWVNLTDYMCDAQICPTIIGNTLAYRDDHHLSATFSEELATVLGEQMALSFAPS